MIGEQMQNTRLASDLSQIRTNGRRLHSSVRSTQNSVNVLKGNFVWVIPTKTASSATGGNSAIDGAPYLEIVSGATSGNEGGHVQNAAGGRVDPGAFPLIRTRVDWMSVAACRIIVAICDSSTFAAAVASDDPGSYQFGVQYSTDRADAEWQAIEKNNGAQTLTPLNAAVTPVIGEMYIETEVLTATTGRVRIEDSTGALLAEETLSTAIPAAGQSLYSAIGIETEEAVAKSHRFFYQEIWI